MLKIMKVIDGRKISQLILSEVKEAVAKLSFRPVFCDILVGGDPASTKYVKMKARRAREVGMVFKEANFPKDISTEKLIKEIKKLNHYPDMCGIIVQLPLPESIDQQKVLDAIDPVLDVDCLGGVASEGFYRGKGFFEFPAALACMHLLDSLDFDLGKKNIVVLGQGKLVGKPVSALLKYRSIQSTAVDKQTENQSKIIKNADIIISGLGLPGYLKGEMLKKGVVLIDAGTSESEGSLVGDVDFTSVAEVVSYLTPVPGGVGPVTVAMLFKNVLKRARSLENAE